MLVTNLQFTNEKYEMGSISITNYPIEEIEDITDESVDQLFLYKYYLHTSYDHINLLNGKEFIITKKTKKAVQLLYVGGNANE